MNPQLKQIPLWQDANQLLLLIEDAVQQFPRYHKYTPGVIYAYSDNHQTVGAYEG